MQHSLASCFRPLPLVWSKYFSQNFFLRQYLFVSQSKRTARINIRKHHILLYLNLHIFRHEAAGQDPELSNNKNSPCLIRCKFLW
jgi:hypothetical protein